MPHASRLHEACIKKDLAKVKEYVRLGDDVNAVDNTENKCLPLTYACFYGQLEMTKVLVDNGADINKTSKANSSPLHETAKMGHEAVAKYLISKGAHLNIQTTIGYTPLHCACHWGKDSVAEVLVENGADINVKDNDGYTPSERAKKQGHANTANIVDKAAILFKEAVQKKKYRLHKACEKKDLAKVKEYVRLGDDVNAVDNTENKCLPLTYACFYGQLEMTKVLVDNGADINKTSKANSSPLHETAKMGHEAVAKYLINKGAHLNIQTTIGYTPLHCAGRWGNDSVAKVLVENGADINVKDNKGKTVRDIASANGHKNVIKVLDNAAEIRKQAKQKNPIEINKPKSNAVEDEEYDEYIQTNAVMNESYKSPMYVTNKNKLVKPNSNGLKLHPLDEAHFDDGTKFIMVGYIGAGQQTYAYSISIARRPKVLKLLQNDESMKDLVVTPAEFKIKSCYPFEGKTREEDYENYLSKFKLVDNDEETLDEYFHSLDSTFTSWQVKEYKGQQYSISELFDVINVSDDKKRDCIRFCYYYYLLNEMKIAHCDVAPRNVLITYDGPVLIDFGASVKFRDINLNSLPHDVTPKFYIDKRVGIRPNHDVKGFYYTSTKYFDIPYDEAIMAELDRRNRLKVEDIILSHCQ